MPLTIVGKKARVAVALLDRIVVGLGNCEHQLTRQALGFGNDRGRQKVRPRRSEVREVALADVAHDLMLRLDDLAVVVDREPEPELNRRIVLFHDADESEHARDRVRNIKRETFGNGRGRLPESFADIEQYGVLGEADPVGHRRGVRVMGNECREVLVGNVDQAFAVAGPRRIPESRLTFGLGIQRFATERRNDCDSYGR